MLPASILGAASGLSGAPAELGVLGKTLYPLFCVSVHEYVWAGGDTEFGACRVETYLERFWIGRQCGTRLIRSMRFASRFLECDLECFHTIII